MPQWDVDPAGITAVLTRTESNATDLVTEFDNVGAAARSAAGQCASPIIAQALANVMSSTSAEMGSVLDTARSAMKACVSATDAYLTADDEMAANATYAPH